MGRLMSKGIKGMIKVEGTEKLDRLVKTDRRFLLYIRTVHHQKEKVDYI